LPNLAPQRRVACSKVRRMSDTVPWVTQVFETDRKLELFQQALEAVANLEPHLNAMPPDQALAVLREVTRAARIALQR
jgi:hypothetical protein